MQNHPLEASLRAVLLAEMPLELAPSFLRMTFHDAGTYDVQTHTGGADGSIHLASERSRSENASLGPCLDILGTVKAQFPYASS